MNKWLAHIIFGAALLFAGVEGVQGQVLDPIAVSLSIEPGQTGEIENALGLPLDGNANGVLPVGDSGEYFFLKGEDSQEPDAGLPVDGTIVSISNTADKIATFQLASYTGPNILISDGTMTLATPASYSHLAFLVDSLTPSHFGEPATFTLNFSDGTSDPIPLSTAENVPNWIGGTPANGSVAYSNMMLYDETYQYFDYSTVNLDEYDFTLSAADAAKTLVSISVNANGGELITYAVSGTDPPAPDTPEPPTWALLALAFGATLFARRLRPLALR